MLTKTKTGAVDLLTVAQNILKDGRPRKPLGRPRPTEKAGKMSLIGSLRYARLILGMPRRQYDAALIALEDEAFWAARPALSYHPTPLGTLAQYDAMELDTRQVIRTLGKAIKELQAP